MEVHLFVPCFMDVLFPEVALATYRVLERAGCRVRYEPGQTCCGQPAFNAGYRAEAKVVASRWRRVFRRARAVVCPSGSCTAMATRYAHELLGPGGPPVFELSQFLVRELGRVDLGARFPHRVAWHDGCHPLRELGVRDEPRALLAAVRDLELVELPSSDRCCGFGGSFAVKFDELSRLMADRKLDEACGVSAEVLVSTESSCLGHLVSRAGMRGLAVRALHLAEVLDSRT